MLQLKAFEKLWIVLVNVLKIEGGDGFPFPSER